MSQIIHMDTEIVLNLSNSIKKFAINIGECTESFNGIVRSLAWEGSSREELVSHTSVLLTKVSNLKIELAQLSQQLTNEIEGQHYSINIDIIAEQNLTAQSLAETKYRYNVNPAFSGENIPPFQLLGQKAGLVAWSCRYRWVDGGSAPYRVQDVFIEVGGKIVHLSFMAAPEDFDFGVLQFIRMAQSAQPI